VTDSQNEQSVTSTDSIMLRGH